MGDNEVSKFYKEKLEKYLDNAQSTAASKVFVCKRDEDEFGSLTITFKDATAATHAGGKNCDLFDPCDPYIKLFVDTENVYTTEIIWEQTNVYFGETYTTKIISKLAPIKIEMWDYDKLSSPDLILSWDTTINELLQKPVKYGHGENKIVTSSFWQPV